MASHLTRVAYLTWQARQQAGLTPVIRPARANGGGHRGLVGDEQRIPQPVNASGPSVSLSRAGQDENTRARGRSSQATVTLSLLHSRSLPGNAPVVDPAFALRPGPKGIRLTPAKESGKRATRQSRTKGW